VKRGDVIVVHAAAGGPLGVLDDTVGQEWAPSSLASSAARRRLRWRRKRLQARAQAWQDERIAASVKKLS
jgi:hypothetical protein